MKPATIIFSLLLVAVFAIQEPSCTTTTGSTVYLSPRGGWTYGENDYFAYNARVQPQPYAIFTPNSTAQVAAILKCSSSKGLATVGLSGRHSYCTNGYGGRNGSVVVDLQNLASVFVDKNTKVIVAGGGARMGAIDQALAKVKGTLPHGTSPYVGVGGHTTGGGYGFTSRKWGMLLDNLVGIEIVLGNGTITYATAEHNSDLFYAVRGAGHSFGIITQFVFKYLPAPPKATVFFQSYQNRSAAQVVHAIEAYQNWTKSIDLPAELGLTLTMSPASPGSGRGFFGFFGSYLGSAQELRTYLDPLLRSVDSRAPDGNITEEYTNYADFLIEVSNYDGNPNYTNNDPDYTDNFYAKSVTVPESVTLSHDTISRYVNILLNEAQTSPFTEWGYWGGKHSAINAQPVDATAFVHRKAMFNVQIYTSYYGEGPFPPHGLDLINNLSKTLTGQNTWEAYQNYADPNLVNWQAKYYGSAYPRLQQLKKKWDPLNTIRFPLSIEQPAH
ncbi:glucooligosaccharide oxidase [Planoprotostelium fungivorum]|uniref:Glucooligosaccharide oxidase n=1 Tax=Planoprotostelium fungivorum TaxID=1890364 RepID=A0A2P6MNV5_9EUKA|nr:glucooligosaccharide oxidase [Planoprotostelium fungivorum]